MDVESPEWDGTGASIGCSPFEQVFAKEKYHCFASNEKGIITGPMSKWCVFQIVELKCTFFKLNVLAVFPSNLLN